MKEHRKHFELKVSQDVFAMYPDYLASVIYAENLVNGQSDAYTRGILRDAETYARREFDGQDPINIPHVFAWREAFRAFGAKPSKYFSGAEALLRRVLDGGSIPSINRVVDIYNALSIKYAIPVGGEDWDQIASDLVLRKSTGDEPFATMSSHGEQTDVPRVGEIVWADSIGATVRRWNWRQCHRTRITEGTTRAYFVLDRMAPLTKEVLNQATREIIEHLRIISPEAILSTALLSQNDR